MTMAKKTLAEAIAEIELERSCQEEAAKYLRDKLLGEPRLQGSIAHRAECMWNLREGKSRALTNALYILAQVDAPRT